MNSRIKIISTLFFLFIAFTAFSQKPIKGIVIDSISFSPLPGVNIQIKNSPRGTSTDGKGEFRLLLKPTDTLIFSLVGYLPEMFTAAELEETALIRMAEEIRMLQTITVHPKGDAEKNLPHLRLQPNTNMMNYGPSSAGINLGYFTKEQKEKRKLSRVVQEHEREKNYIAVVTSPEVRERIIYDYNLSEDEFYQILASFNIENGESLYVLSSEELVVVMNTYFKKFAHRR